MSLRTFFNNLWRDIEIMHLNGNADAYFDDYDECTASTNEGDVVEFDNYDYPDASALYESVDAFTDSGTWAANWRYFDRTGTTPFSDECIDCCKCVECHSEGVMCGWLAYKQSVARCVD